MSISAWLKRRQVNEKIQCLVSEDERCCQLIDKINNLYGICLKTINLSNLSVYFFIDMLEKAFAKANVSLPAVIDVLDIGTADWYYASALLSFLRSWQDPKAVNLHGIDFPKKIYKKSINRLRDNCPLEIHWGDVMNFETENKFDLIFLNHMLVGPNHCRNWKIPYHPFEELLPHLESLNKPHGLIVITANTYAGESSIANCFSQESKLTEFVYDPDIKEDSLSFLRGFFGFHDNLISICRSPYVDLEGCQWQDEHTKEWDSILKRL